MLFILLNEYGHTIRIQLRSSPLVWQSIDVSDVFSSVDKWLTVPEVGELLGLTPGKVHRLVEEHALFFVPREGVKSVPAHLIVDGEPLSSLPGTISVLIDAGFTLGQSIEWLYTPEDSLGHAPIDSLLAGRKTEVRRIAQSLAF
jgi:hypothetical protein